MTFCGTAFAEEQTAQPDEQQSYVYQTEDGVLSIEAPDAQWQVMSDPNHWFVLSDGSNTITVDHLANGESLPAPVVADEETAGVYQAFVSTKNEVFVVEGSAAKQEDLVNIMKTISTIKVLKYDTKTAVKQEPAASTGIVVNPINATYYCVSDSLNVRTGCSTNDTAIGSLTYGEAVTVLGSVTQDGQDTGWYQISYNGTTAYASAQYLSASKPEAKAETPSTSASAESDYFPVYSESGPSIDIHPVGGAMYEDHDGKTYVDQGDGVFYCITTDTYYGKEPAVWAYGALSGQGENSYDVNIEGDNYDDADIDYSGVNVEG